MDPIVQLIDSASAFFNEALRDGFPLSVDM
ncbi:unnamed protein product [Victoria cruziana]